MIKIVGQLTLSDRFGFGDPEQQPEQTASANPTNTEKPRTKKKRRRPETYMIRLMWAISGPIIVWPGYTDVPIPGDARSEVQIERLMILAKEEKLASEAEAMWYISRASLINPLNHNWVNIMMYLTRKWMLKLKKPLPDFLQDQIELERYMEEEALHRFRGWLFNRSFEAVKNKPKYSP